MIRKVEMGWLKTHSNARKTRKEKQPTWVELLKTGKQLKSKREKSLLKEVRIKKDSLCKVGNVRKIKHEIEKDLKHLRILCTVTQW